MNEFVSSLDSHYQNFDNKPGELLPAFIRWDSSIENYDKINPKENTNDTKDPEIFGDNWSDELEISDKDKIFEYFKKFDHIKKNFGFNF